MLAFAEGRRTSAADHGDIEVVSRRSTDGGCHWGPLARVSDNGRKVAGNPAPVVDPASGDVVLLTTRQSGSVTQPEIEAGTVSAGNSRRVYVQRSADAGATWSRAREITRSVKPSGWRWYATGPGHGIALTQRHPGRLVVAANHTTARGSGAHLLYSDDHGRTWPVGALDHHTDGRLRPDENAVAELPDGRLYVNARDQGGSHPATRLDTYSADGGTRFTAPYQPRPKLVAPVVKGALLHADDAACPALLFSAPRTPARAPPPDGPAQHGRRPHLGARGRGRRRARRLLRPRPDRGRRGRGAVRDQCRQVHRADRAAQPHPEVPLRPAGRDVPRDVRAPGRGGSGRGPGRPPRGTGPVRLPYAGRTRAQPVLRSPAATPLTVSSRARESSGSGSSPRLAASRCRCSRVTWR